MEFRKLIEDEDAVSPVIGVILMVAITVILAAVIGTFVLGLGDQVSNTSPQASFTFDYDQTNTNLTVTHDGGDSIPSERLNITDGTNTGTWDTLGGTSGDVSAGESVDVGDDGATDDGADDYNVASDATVRVVWSASGGGDTSTVGKWTGPDA